MHWLKYFRLKKSLKCVQVQVCLIYMLPRNLLATHHIKKIDAKSNYVNVNPSHKHAEIFDIVC